MEKDFSRKLEASASFWLYDDEWVENRFKWAAKHPGLGCPENEERDSFFDPNVSPDKFVQNRYE
ncbi:hypothetical protein PILCRDRAFT_822815 [Piloderma croceum F 1598]|uniref:Uncharacterized protein n=1 Tax=Piloderma croceum (strain F 1598) TaxID=765440 RepID=A0A0C3BRJ0_PILCF|nr:hypothetical protein PILCRDRAFT_822815 [Piloderma croceum F 1598]